MLSGIEVSRRTLFLGIAISSVIPAQDVGRIVKSNGIKDLAFAVENEISTVSPTVRFFSVDLLQAYRAEVATTFNVKASPLKSCHLELTYDMRIFAEVQSLSVVSEDNARSLRREEFSATGHSASAIFDISEALADQEDIHVIVPLHSIIAFPEDQIDDPIEPRLSFVAVSKSGAKAVKSVSAWSMESRLDFTACALEVSGAWTNVVEGNDDNLVYRAPAAIRISNAGPGQSPEGVLLTLRADPGLVSLVGITPSDNLTTEMLGGQEFLPIQGASSSYATTFVLPSIPAGGEIALAVDWLVVGYPAEAKGAIASVAFIDFDAETTAINRTSDESLAIRDSTSSESLYPLLDVSRMAG